MRAFVIFFVSLFFILGSVSADAVPPICENPASVPFELAGLYSTEVITNIGLDREFPRFDGHLVKSIHS